MNRALTARAKLMDVYKRFVMAVGTYDIQRLHQLVNNCLKGGLSIHTTLEHVILAKNDMWKTKSYQDDDHEKAFLLLALGGRACCEIGHHALGLPSLSMTRRHTKKEHPLQLSCSAPMETQLMNNLLDSPQFVDAGVTEAKGFQAVVGVQIGIDEISLEQRLRWQHQLNLIAGVCCHSDKHGTVLDFDTITQAIDVSNELKAGRIHLAKEVSRVISDSDQSHTHGFLARRQQWLLLVPSLTTPRYTMHTHF